MKFQFFLSLVLRTDFISEQEGVSYAFFNMENKLCTQLKITFVFKSTKPLFQF